MKEKGVSNLIASVLLIVIALSLASVLYAWSTGWVSEQLGRVSQIPQGEFALEVATLTGSNDTGTLIVRNVGTAPILITDRQNPYHFLITLYINGTIIPAGTKFTSVNDLTDGRNLMIIDAQVPENHVMRIVFNTTGGVMDIIAGTTYEIKLTLSDGTPLIIAVTAA